MSIINFTRRSFLKGAAFCAGGLFLSVHWTGRAFAGTLNLLQHMQARIAGVYREDKMFEHRASQDNPQIQQLYKEFLGKPLSEKSEQLLHTKWFNKSEAVTKLHKEGAYPGPRGGEFKDKKYPFVGLK